MTEAIAGMETVFSKLQKSSNGLEKAFANIISKADGMGLTFEDLQNLENFEDSVSKDANGELVFDEALSELYAQVAGLFTKE
jgi:hypothetical protein